MNKRLFSLLFLILFTLAVSAQQSKNDLRVDSIRKTYQEISQKIESLEKDEEAARTSDLAVNELVVNKMNRSWAAVGNYRVVFRFFYQNRVEEPYPTQLVKVTKETEAAARKYYEEFVYDGDGRLIFYFEKSDDGEEPLERRIYYHKGRAFRLIEDETSKEKLDKGDREKSRGALASSKKIVKIFINSIEG